MWIITSSVPFVTYLYGEYWPSGSKSVHFLLSLICIYIILVCAIQYITSFPRTLYCRGGLLIMRQGALGSSYAVYRSTNSAWESETNRPVLRSVENRACVRLRVCSLRYSIYIQQYLCFLRNWSNLTCFGDAGAMLFVV